MSNYHEYFHIITGGPGSGKTTLLHSLEDRYFLTMPEGAGAIIQDQTAIDGQALPWKDKAAYAELMLNWELRSYREAPRGNRPVLFERGIPDIIGYLELNRLPVPQHLINAATNCRYHKNVFIAPHWPEIYSKGGERKESPEDARAAFEAVMNVYRRLGYELLELPKGNLDARVRFIMDNLGDAR
jgi:predicted ATPase